MSIEKNIQTVKDFFAAIGRGDRKALLALVAEDIEWIIPGKDWPLAGTRHGHAGLADLLETASKSMETSTEPREFVAQGDRVLVVGFARGKIKATNKTFEDDWIFAITVRDGKLTSIRTLGGHRRYRRSEVENLLAGNVNARTLATDEG